MNMAPENKAQTKEQSAATDEIITFTATYEKVPGKPVEIFLDLKIKKKFLEEEIDNFPELISRGPLTHTRDIPSTSFQSAKSTGTLHLKH